MTFQVIIEAPALDDLDAIVRATFAVERGDLAHRSYARDLIAGNDAGALRFRPRK
ncbi:MAG TPA: hypothetical protein VNT79_07990 [Phycisphaerae bacterium]|nr:hypothetical protein [Phycisphaerae bacterium]